MTTRSGTRAAQARERRAAIIETAFHHIAEFGMEGLRVRDVAAAVGINIATLHYYFPSKEHLIAAVVEHLTEQMARLMPVPDAGPPRERLHTHLAHVTERLAADPAPFRVAVELAARGPRDPVIRQALLASRQQWQAALTSLLQQIDPTTCVAETRADLMMATLQGIMLDPLGDHQRTRLVIQELERVVLAPSEQA